MGRAAVDKCRMICLEIGSANFVKSVCDDNKGHTLDKMASHEERREKEAGLTAVDARLLGDEAHAGLAVLTLWRHPLAEQLRPRLLILYGVKDLLVCRGTR